MNKVSLILQWKSVFSDAKMSKWSFNVVTSGFHMINNGWWMFCFSAMESPFSVFCQLCQHRIRHSSSNQFIDDLGPQGSVQAIFVYKDPLNRSQRSNDFHCKMNGTLFNEQLKPSVNFNSLQVVRSCCSFSYYSPWCHDRLTYYCRSFLSLGSTPLIFTIYMVKKKCNGHFSKCMDIKLAYETSSSI